MSYESSDFYCNIEKLDNFCISFKPIMDNLIKYFEYVKEKIAYIESNDLWSGNSFNSFKESFLLFESDFLRLINMLIQYTTNLASIQVYVVKSIELRNKMDE